VIRSRRKRPASAAAIHRFVVDSGGLQYATEAMKRHAADAAAVFQAFPPSDARDALIDLTNYVVARRH
jgi:octaprenyl-diphosphate synthase